MAIDTRTKRQNAAQVGCPLPVSILPSGSVAAAARAQAAWTYGGITISPPAAGTAAQDKIAFGFQVTPRETTIGGWN